MDIGGPEENWRKLRMKDPELQKMTDESMNLHKREDLKATPLDAPIVEEGLIEDVEHPLADGRDMLLETKLRYRDYVEAREKRDDVEPNSIDF